MKVEIETKKITVDPSTLAPTVTCEFKLGRNKDLEEFKEQLRSFQNKLAGQAELIK